jgi:hypothetical protein
VSQGATALRTPWERARRKSPLHREPIPSSFSPRQATAVRVQRIDGDQEKKRTTRAGSRKAGSSTGHRPARRPDLACPDASLVATYTASATSFSPDELVAVKPFPGRFNPRSELKAEAQEGSAGWIQGEAFFLGRWLLWALVTCLLVSPGEHESPCQFLPRTRWVGSRASSSWRSGAIGAEP